MPLNYLHVCNGIGFIEDEDGMELPSAEFARQKAVEGLRDIMADELKGGVINMASFIEIEDENRSLIATISFEDAVHFEHRQDNRPER